MCRWEGSLVSLPCTCVFAQVGLGLSSVICSVSSFLFFVMNWWVSFCFIVFFIISIHLFVLFTVCCCHFVSSLLFLSSWSTCFFCFIMFLISLISVYFLAFHSLFYWFGFTSALLTVHLRILFSSIIFLLFLFRFQILSLNIETSTFFSVLQLLTSQFLLFSCFSFASPLCFIVLLTFTTFPYFFWQLVRIK